MERNDIHDEEHIQHPRIDTIGKDNPFSTPNGYFTKLSDQITGTIAIYNITAKAENGGLNVPQNYFTTLSDQIQTNITADQWSKTDSQQAFTVPDNYFEQTKENIIKATSNTAITESPKIKRMLPAFIKYAAAACILIISGLTLYNNVNKEDSLNDKLANVSEEAIVNYLISRSDTGDIPVILANSDEKAPITHPVDVISDKELSEYLDVTAL